MAEKDLAAEANREKERKLKDAPANSFPEGLTNLLGFSGLAWERQDKLHEIFPWLQAASGRNERHAILKALMHQRALGARKALQRLCKHVPI